MSETEKLVIKRFPRREAQIEELMGSQSQFASICRDYSDIVVEIGNLDQSVGPNAKVLADLHELRLGLEHDILDWLNDTTNSSTTSE